MKAISPSLSLSLFLHLSVSLTHFLYLCLSVILWSSVYLFFFLSLSLGLVSLFLSYFSFLLHLTFCLISLSLFFCLSNILCLLSPVFLSPPVSLLHAYLLSLFHYVYSMGRSFLIKILLLGVFFHCVNYLLYLFHFQSVPVLVFQFSFFTSCLIFEIPHTLMVPTMFSATFSVPMKSSMKETHFIDRALFSPANNIFSFLLNATEYMYNFTVTSEVLGDKLAIVTPVKYFLLDL